MSEWKKIDSAPKDRLILIWVPAPWSEVKIAKWHEPYKAWVDGGDRYRERLPTHWMELPGQPEAEA